MAIDHEFLRKVADAGWIMLAVDNEAVLCGCPRDGCSLKVRLAPDRPVPKTCKRGPDLVEKTVKGFDDGRLFLRERREALCLTIEDVETIAGLSGSHVAKMEKDDPAKIPNIETFILWANALGYDLILRPGELSPYALRVLAKPSEKRRQIRMKYQISARRRLQKP